MKFLDDCLTNWEKTVKYYPQMAKQGYTFCSNMSKTENVEDIKLHKTTSPHQMLIDGDYYTEEKRVIVKGFMARRDNGKVDKSLWVVFSKLKEIKETQFDRNVRKLNKANDTICIVSGVTYDRVMELRKELIADGIDANITTGGLQIYANAQNAKVVKLCKKYKTLPEPGVSRFVEQAMLRE